MQYTTLLFDIRDGVAQITLNRPEASNSMNLDMTNELMHAAMHCSRDPMVRAVMISGSGKTFCPGGDIKAFAAQGENLPHYLKEMTTYLHAAVSLLARTDAPVVMAVKGAAAGAGMSLTCGGDIVIAAESARFVMAYSRVGLPPDGGSSYFLPRIVGLKRALELALTNRELSAQEALDLGIVTQVVADTEVLSRAGAVAAQLAAGPTKALGATKRLMHSGWSETLETQMEQESWGIADMACTLDAQEGIAAFLGKRSPEFNGQ